jgi:hypothetical protein
MILIRETFRCRGVYTQLPLHRDAFTQVLWHANTSTQCFYGRILLRRNSSAHIACKHFYIETFWHTVAGAFTCKYFTRQCLLCAYFLFTYMHALSQKCFQSHILLQSSTLKQPAAAPGCLLQSAHTAPYSDTPAAVTSCRLQNADMQLSLYLDYTWSKNPNSFAIRGIKSNHESLGKPETKFKNTLSLEPTLKSP